MSSEHVCGYEYIGNYRAKSVKRFFGFCAKASHKTVSKNFKFVKSFTLFLESLYNYVCSVEKLFISRVFIFPSFSGFSFAMPSEWASNSAHSITRLIK